jgi:hypothetical protein
MPITVPKYEDRTREAGLPNVRFSTEAPIEAFGGTGKGYQAAGELLGTATKIVAEEKRKADDVMTQSVYADAVRELNQMRYGQDGLVTRTGEKAFGAPDDFRKRVDEKFGALRERLTNGEQKAMFAQMEAKLRTDFDGDVQRHVFTERKRFHAEKTKALITTLQEDSVLNYQTPGKVEENVQLMRAAIAQFSVDNGIPKEVREKETTEAVSRAHKGIIERMISNGQDLDAKAHYEKNLLELSGSDVADVEKLIKHGSTLGEAQRVAAAITAKTGNMSAALKELDAIADPQVKAKATDLVKERFSMIEAGKKQAKEASYEALAKQLERDGDLLAIQRDARWLNLEDSQQAALMNRYDRKIKGIDRKNDDSKFVEFIFLSQGQLASLTQTEYETKYRQHFSNAFQAKADAEIERAKKGGEENKLFTPFSSYKDQFDSTLGSRGVVDPRSPNKSKADAKKYDDLALAVRQRVEDYETKELGGKRRITTKEIQSIIDEQLLKQVRVRSKGWFGMDSYSAEKPAGLVADNERGQMVIRIKDVPENVRNDIRQDFQDYLKKMGWRRAPITDRELEQLAAFQAIRDQKGYDDLMNQLARQE